MFDKGAHGEFKDGAVTKYFVNPNAGKTLAEITKPGIDAAEGWKHTGWDKEDTTAIGAEGLTVTAQYAQNPSIVANPVQKYDEPTDDQYIEGVLPAGKTLPKNAKVELVVKNGENYEKVDVPVTIEDGVIKVDVKNENIKHDGTYYFAITEEGKVTSYSDTPVTVDKEGPALGTPGNEINLVQDHYGYQVKISAEAKDQAGILRVYAEEDKDGGFYNEQANETTANLSESIQDQLGKEKTFKVTAVDKFGNKTEATKTVEPKAKPLVIKAVRPLGGNDYIYVTADAGTRFEIKVINADGSETILSGHDQVEGTDKVQLVNTDGTPFTLVKGQKIKISATKDDQSAKLTIRVR